MNPWHAKNNREKKTWIVFETWWKFRRRYQYCGFTLTHKLITIWDNMYRWRTHICLLQILCENSNLIFARKYLNSFSNNCSHFPYSIIASEVSLERYHPNNIDFGGENYFFRSDILLGIPSHMMFQVCFARHI